MSYERVGEFDVKSGHIEVSDPCYEGGNGNHLKAKNGRWVAEVRRADEGGWGVRIAALRASHEMFDGEITTGIGTASVDSGQMSISDGERFHNLLLGDYETACAATLGKLQTGIVGNYAAVSSSGYGDGGYQILAAQDHGEIVAVEVVFIPEPLVCIECGCTFEPQESRDESYCEDCYLDLFESDDCSICGSRVPHEELEDGMCDQCYGECDGCGAVMAKDELVDGHCDDCQEMDGE